MNDLPGKVAADPRPDPQLSPWAREKSLNALASSMASFSEDELPYVLARALIARLGADQASDALCMACGLIDMALVPVDMDRL